jgi:hypothetical protein
MALTANIVQLKARTLEGFEAHIRESEAAMNQTLHGNRPFLWSDTNSDWAQQVRQGNIVAEIWSDQGSIKVPNGLIHDWVGAAFISRATVEDVVALVQDYDNHKNIYKPEVLDSKLIRRDGNDFQIYLRLLKKKIITVVLDTDHDVHYSLADDTRWLCRSYTTRIAEVEDPGTAKEKVLTPDTGYGFLWRLYSYWRFQEKDGGVYIECRAISLSRDIPLGLGWIIQPIIRKLPPESLINTLRATRDALSAGHCKKASARAGRGSGQAGARLLRSVATGHR